MNEKELWTAYQVAIVGWQTNPSRTTGIRMADAFEAWCSEFLGNPTTARQQAEDMRAELSRSVAWVKSA